MGIETLDWFVIAAYFAVILCIAGWAILRERASGRCRHRRLGVGGRGLRGRGAPAGGVRPDPALRERYDHHYEGFRSHYPAMRPLFV